VTQDLHSLAERVDKLERQNRRLKLVGVGALLFAGAILLMGQRSPTNTVSAHEFVLTDDKGQTRGRWYTTPDSTMAMLDMYDPTDHLRLGLMSSGTGATITLFDSKSKLPRGQLSAGERDSALWLKDSKGFSVWVGNAYLETEKTGRRQQTSAASLALFGQDSKLLWSAP